MTNLPDDAIDASEARFARRVRDYTDPAVVPVDPTAVASEAAAGAGGPRRSGTRRLGWLFAGATAVAGVAAVAILLSAPRGPNVGASPTPAAAAVGICAPAQLVATVASWEGAAGHRIGTLTVTNTGNAPCGLPGSIRPALIDRAGHDLIVGKVANVQPVEIADGGSVQTLVQTGNYCGPTAQEPAAVALDLAAAGRVVAKPAAGDASSGVPPCMGENGPTDDITIQDWGVPQG